MRLTSYSSRLQLHRGIGQRAAAVREPRNSSAGWQALIELPDTATAAKIAAVLRLETAAVSAETRCGHWIRPNTPRNHPIPLRVPPAALLPLSALRSLALSLSRSPLSAPSPVPRLSRALALSRAARLAFA